MKYKDQGYMGVAIQVCKTNGTSNLTLFLPAARSD